MKKIGIIAIVLVLCLAVVGVGFAKWSSTIRFNGNIETGEVSIGISDIGTTDDGVTSAWEIWRDDVGLDEQAQWIHDLYPGGIFPEDEYKDVASFTSQNVTGDYRGVKTVDVTPWRDNDQAESVQDINFYKGVREIVTNAYPGYKATTRLLIGCFGTVPVKIDDIRFQVSQGNADLLKYMVIENAEYAYIPGGQLQVASGGNEGGGICELGSMLEGMQLHPCDTLLLILTFHFVEEVDLNEDGRIQPEEVMPQGDSVVFDIGVTASQWNEVV